MDNKIGIILGSGLNKFTEELTSPRIISHDENSFHNICVYEGKIAEKTIILFSGRRHLYEGYTPDKILENVEIAKKQGVGILIVTNAAGGINTGFKVADLMLITSHINLLNRSIAHGHQTIFYDRKLSEKVKQIAIEEKIILRYGSYFCNQGPMYETKSEIRYLTKYGIDAVGMSTVPEIIYANKLGMKTIGFSCITNLLNESSLKITDHDEVVEAGRTAFQKFSKLLKKIIIKSGELLEK